MHEFDCVPAGAELAGDAAAVAIAMPPNGPRTEAQPLSLAEQDPAFIGTELQSATLSVFTSLRAAEKAWRRAVEHCACFVFQSYEWNATWLDTVGRTERISEYIVHLAAPDGSTLLMLPLAVSEQRGLRILGFFGGEMADYNAPLIDREFARTVDADHLQRLWRVVLDLLPEVDAVWLTRMPQTIDGVRNPMTELTRVRHTGDAYAATLPASFKEFTATRSTQFFAQIRRHRRRLEKVGVVDVCFPTDAAERMEVVRALAKQKSDWLRSHGFANAFKRPSTLEFYERLITSQLQGGTVLVACLRVGDQIAATLLGAVFGSRYYFLVPSYSEEWRRYSPGRILTESVVQRCIAQGDVRVFDLTIGDESYKLTWSDHSIALHEYLEARSLRGTVFVAYRRLRSSVRSHPATRALVRAVRERMRRFSQGGPIRPPAESSPLLTTPALGPVEHVVTGEFDCVIVGAGLAGAASAVVMARDGVRVALVDPRASCLPTFKAEKIEPDQVELLHRLGLAEGVLSRAARIRSIQEAKGGRLLRTVPIEQYGMSYQDMVNAVRAQLPATVVQKVARVTDVRESARDSDRQSVTLDTGEILSARLVVLAAGVGGSLHSTLGIERRVIRAAHSVCYGFDIARVDGQPFPFEALTYFADSLDNALDYVTLFLLPGRMRVNLFSYLDPKHPWFRQLARQPRATLDRALPGATGLIGDWTLTSRVESHGIALYHVDPPSLNGVVLIGDASQSVCPATGTGLSKVLTDVDVLCHTWLPSWLATPGMPAAKVAAYYSDERKIAVDQDSLAKAEVRRHVSTNDSWRWRIHRQRSYMKMRWT